MADFLPPLVAIITANASQFFAEMGKVMASVDSTTGKSATSFQKLASVGGFAAKAIGIAGIGIGIASVELANNFQQAMLLVQNQAGASAKEVKNLGDYILQLAPKVGASPKALADALFFVESAGIRGAAAEEDLKIAAEGAAVGHANLTDTTKALVAIMNTHVAGTSNARDVMGQLNAIVGQGMMKFSELASSMSSGILSVMQTFGVSLQSVGASMDVMTNAGVPAEQAATRLRMGLALMAAPSKQAAGILKDIGMASTDNLSAMADMNAALAKSGIAHSQLAADLKQPDGILVAMQDMKKHMTAAGISADVQADVISRAFGGGRLGTAIMSSFSNMDQMKEKFDAIGTTANQFGDAWKRQSASFGQQVKELKAQTESWGVQLGLILIPKLLELGHLIADVVTWLTKHKEVAILLGIAIGSILAVAMAAWVVSLFAVGGALAFIDVPLLLIMAGIALLGIAIYETITHWKQIKEVIGEVADFIVRKWHQAIDFFTKSDLGKIIGVGILGLMGPIGLLVGAVYLLVTHWHEVTKAVGDFLSATGRIASEVGDYISKPFISFFNWIEQQVSILTTWWHQNWDSIRQVVQMAATVVSTIVKIWIDYIVFYFRMFMATVGPLWHTFWDTLGGIVKAGVDFVLTIVKVGWDFLQGLFQTAWDVIVGIVKVAWARIMMIFTTSRDFILGIISVFLDLVTGKWGKAWTDIKNTASRIWNDIKEMASQVWNAVADMFKRIWGDIEHTFEHAFNDVIDGIITFAKDVVTMFIHLGEDIIKGIIHGIKNMGSAVKDAVTSVANDAIDGVKNFLGIGSPSRLFADNIGAPMSQGIASGITDGSSAIDSAMTGILNPDNFSGEVSQSGATLGKTWAEGLKGGFQSAMSNLGAFVADNINAINDATARGLDPQRLMNDIQTGNIGDISSYGQPNPFGTRTRWAEGGLVSTATLGLLGEAGPELILPLSDMARTVSLLTGAGVISNFGEPRTTFNIGLGGGGDAITVNVYPPVGMDTKQVAREVLNELNKFKRNNRSSSITNSGVGLNLG